jgi:hypothetical protein
MGEQLPDRRVPVPCPHLPMNLDLKKIKKNKKKDEKQKEKKTERTQIPQEA